MKYILFALFALNTCQATAQGTGTKKDGQARQYIEVMPKAGYDIGQYLGENMHYPEHAREHNIEGRVIIKFIVNEDGHISDCTVMKSIDEECDAEALRVVQSMPPWKPGMQDGKAVKVYFTIPIVFRLEDDKTGQPSVAQPSSEGVYSYVQVMPVAPYDVKKYLADNVHYPAAARKNHVEGRVVIKFVVNEDGSIFNCSVKTGIGSGCDEEALRVVKSMPPWKPGENEGKPKKVYYYQPVVFEGSK